MNTPLSDEIRALIAYANETTEGADSNLGDAVKTLCDGYGKGGGETAEPEAKDVNFYDYDGTRLYAYTLAEAKALTALPAPKDHSHDEVPMVFEEWNFTMEDIRALTTGADVAPFYHTADNKMHLRCKIRKDITTRIAITLSQSSVCSVDWGDGTVDTDASARTGNKLYTHSYASDFDGWVVVDTRNANFQIAASHDNDVVKGFRAILCPVCMNAWLARGLQAFNDLEYIVYSSQINFNNGASYIFQGEYSLKFFSLPRGKAFGSAIFSGFNPQALKVFSHPMVTIKGTETSPFFPQSQTLKHLRIPDSSDYTNLSILNCNNLEELIIPEGYKTGTFTNSFNYGWTAPYIRIPSTWTQGWTQGRAARIDITEGWVPGGNIEYSSRSATISGIVEFFNKLGNGTVTIYLASTIKNQMTAEQLAIATDKGYTIGTR